MSFDSPQITLSRTPEGPLDRDYCAEDLEKSAQITHAKRVAILRRVLLP